MMEIKRRTLRLVSSKRPDRPSPKPVALPPSRPPGDALRWQATYGSALAQLMYDDCCEVNRRCSRR